jgi:agarase
MLKDKYKSIETLNDAWGSEFGSWDEFAGVIDAQIRSEQQTQDYAELLYAYGNQYFGTVKKALKSVLPNHLYLGSRFPIWGMPPEIVHAAANHLDVITYNLYEEGLVPEKWAFLEEIDMPSLIGEFSFGSDDAGHFHPGIVISADQEDRGRMFKNYLWSVIDNPWFVGAHMFQYVDSPITGRAYDGENYNNGFVAVTDVPYAPMVRAAKEVNSQLYQRRFGSPAASEGAGDD